MKRRVMFLGSSSLTRHVELKGFLTGIDGNRDWTCHSERFLQSGLVALRNINEAVTGRCHGFSSEFARCFILGDVDTRARWMEPIDVALYLSNVRVRRFVVNALVVMDVFECIVHKTAVTSVIAPVGRAIHQLLFAEAN